MRTILLLLAACAPKVTPPESATPTASATPAAPARPDTKRVDTSWTIAGQTLSDPYQWLEDEKSAETQSWMTAQDGYARAALATAPGRDKLTARLKELYYIDSTTTPVVRGDRLFYKKQAKGQEKASLYWRGADGVEKLLLDPSTFSTDNTVSLGDWTPSWDGKKLAFQKNPNSADEATQYVMDVDTGAVSTMDVIEGAKYASISWTPDGAGFYYEWLPTDTTIPVDQRPGYTECRYHALGADPKKDTTVRPKTGDPETFLDCSLSRDGKYLTATIAHGWTATDVWLKDLRQAKNDWVEIVKDQPSLYVVDVWKDQLYIYTDEGAPHKRIFTTPTAKPHRKNWTELVPEDKDATLDTFAIVGGKLGLSYLRNVQSELRLVSLDGKTVTPVALPAIGSASGFSGSYDGDRAFFSFSSFTLPPEILEVNTKAATTTSWVKTDVPIDPNAYTVDQVWYPSKDGTKVPMFLIHKKDAQKNGQNPTLLYGYGGFDVSLTPDFRARLYPWLEAGGIYAVANLRGGGEFGKAWHEAGMLDKKQNVFDDFIAAAEYLQKEGWTSKDKLAVQGGSNGGLLTSAVMSQRPDLYRAVVCQVPLIDMVRYHLFGSGRTWIPEYGTAEDPAQYPFISAYSPYQKVKDPTAWPALLMMSADHDDRVDPMHARKFVAAVQHTQTADRPILLRIERNAGHGGADQVKQSVEYYTDMYSFLFQQLGMNP